MRSRLAVTTLIGLLLVGLGPAVVAWSPSSQVSIAAESAHLAPADLRRQMLRHPQSLHNGALAPFKGTGPSAHYWHKNGAGELDHVLFAEVDAAIQAIQQHRPFSEIVWRLGVVSHYVADANNPLNAAGHDPAEGKYFADFLRYMESAGPRFALVFYAGEAVPEHDREMRLMVYRALYRSRQLYPLVGAEYRRIGFASGVREFDDRSTAFGVAAVSFSHAVSDMARVLRYIWLRGGGAVEDTPLWRIEEERVIVLRHRISAP